MKISLKVLSHFIDDKNSLELLRKESKNLIEKLPFLGLEIGGVQQQGEGLDKVVIAEILEFEKHPKADKLNVCKVNAGGPEPLQIVCGAPNVRKGMKVALAPVGAVLPGDFAIKPAKIRDVESFGMLCSSSELGIPGESDGILDLNSEFQVGESFVKEFQLDDEIWEIELTPDRADCLSHLGVAREVARLLGRKVKVSEFEDLVSSFKDVPLFNVEVQAEKECPIYGAVLLEDVQKTKTPDWMVSALDGLGLRTHNALVDITNYVLHEFGHPMHAFDADQVAGSKLIIRFAKNGEKLTTLDEEERTLTEDDLIIADIEKPLALAGVMGGLDSSVTESTKRVILESAYFDPELVRKMAARHRMHSDSSHRFERGVDPNNIKRSAGRACLLFKEICGMRRRGSMVEVCAESATELREKNVLNFDLRAFQKLVGIEAKAEEISSLFNVLGMSSQVKSPNVLRVEVPTYRIDLLREVDLIEESARLLGYDKIPEIYPVQKNQTRAITQSLQHRLSVVRERILDTGLCETMPYCFISDKAKAWVPKHPLVELQNPLSQEWKFMRPNLTFGLLEVLKQHVAMSQNNAGLFDIGHAFSQSHAKDERSSGVTESYHFAWAQMGHSFKEHWSKDKKSNDRKQLVDFFDARGIFDKLQGDLAALEGRWAGAQFISLETFMKNDAWRTQLEAASWIPAALLHPTRSALIVWPGKPPGSIVGWVGELHPQKKSEILNLAAGLNLGVAMGEIRFSPNIMEEMQLCHVGKPPQSPQPYGKISVASRTPIVERDISLVFPPEATAMEIEKTLAKAMGTLLKKVECLDLYPMKDAKKSLAYRLFLQDDEGTLDEKTIQSQVKLGLDALVEKFGAEQRA